MVYTNRVWQLQQRRPGLDDRSRVSISTQIHYYAHIQAPGTEPPFPFQFYYVFVVLYSTFFAACSWQLSHLGLRAISYYSVIFQTSPSSFLTDHLLYLEFFLFALRIIARFSDLLGPNSKIWSIIRSAAPNYNWYDDAIIEIALLFYFLRCSDPVRVQSVNRAQDHRYPSPVHRLSTIRTSWI
ncbi:hypothetical protein AFLA_008308 [Aspergillus flavus NRRL3357]|nr:hypothetical protein AFLA_008308 [Aspergillus flavus NRRL3357]